VYNREREQRGKNCTYPIRWVSGRLIPRTSNQSLRKKKGKKTKESLLTGEKLECIFYSPPKKKEALSKKAGKEK